MTHTRIDNKEEIKKTIKETFEGDDELFETFHIISNDVESAIEDTFSKVAEMVEAYGAFFYKLSKEKKTIGYICVALSMKTLYSFGLNKKYRSEENKKQMIDLIDSFFDGDMIVCSLFKKNTRGLSFLMKNGYEEQNYTTLIKKKEQCQ